MYVKYDVKPEFRSRPPGSRSDSFGNNTYNAMGANMISSNQPASSDPRSSHHGSDGGIAMTSPPHEQETTAEDGTACFVSFLKKLPPVL